MRFSRGRRLPSIPLRAMRWWSTSRSLHCTLGAGASLWVRLYMGSERLRRQSGIHWAGCRLPGAPRRRLSGKCGREDSNFHGVTPTSTSSLRVYHSATTARAGGGV